MTLFQCFVSARMTALDRATDRIPVYIESTTFEFLQNQNILTELQIDGKGMLPQTPKFLSSQEKKEMCKISTILPILCEVP